MYHGKILSDIGVAISHTKQAPATQKPFFLNHTYYRILFSAESLIVKNKCYTLYLIRGKNILAEKYGASFAQKS